MSERVKRENFQLTQISSRASPVSAPLFPVESAEAEAEAVEATEEEAAEFEETGEEEEEEEEKVAEAGVAEAVEEETGEGEAEAEAGELCSSICGWTRVRPVRVRGSWEEEEVEVEVCGFLPRCLL